MCSKRQTIERGTIATIVSCLAFLGCSSPQYRPNSPHWNGSYRLVPVYLDTSLSSIIQEEALDAVREFNQAVNGRIVLLPQSYDIAGGSDLGAMKQAEENNAIVIIGTTSKMGMMASLEGAVAITYPYGHSLPSALIYIAQDTIPLSVGKYILLHELGHAFGLEDTGNEDTLMDRTFVRPHCLDRRTMQGIAKKMGWAVETMNWCT